MSAYLAYSYSSCLTEKEKSKIDKKVNISQKEFCKGFRKGTQISLSIYSLYLLTIASAYAVDSGADACQAGAQAGGQELPAPLIENTVVPVPAPKPGFKPLSEGAKGAFVGGASAICGTALQTGDFYLGLACAGLLVIGGIVINRSD